MKSRLMKALSWAVFPALLVAGFAVASPGSDVGGDGEGAEDEFTVAVPAPPVGAVAFAGPGERFDGELLSVEFHVLRDGETVTVLMDRGTVDGVSESEVTVTREDGTQTTFPVDSETEVIRPPDLPRPDAEDGDIPPKIEPIEPGNVGDLEVGDEIMVHHEEGQPADFIGVMPEGGRRFMPLPPPGAPELHRFGPPGHVMPAPPPEAGEE